MFSDKSCVFININKLTQPYDYTNPDNNYYECDLDVNCNKMPAHKKIIIISFALMLIISIPFIIYDRLWKWQYL